MPIVEWSSLHDRGWRPADGVERTLLDVEDGRIRREIGLGASGEVMYIAPAERGPYPYGQFDLQTLGAGTDPEQDEFPRDAFEALWRAGAARFGARASWSAGSRHE